MMKLVQAQYFTGKFTNMKRKVFVLIQGFAIRRDHFPELLLPSGALSLFGETFFYQVYHNGNRG